MSSDEEFEEEVIDVESEEEDDTSSSSSSSDELDLFEDEKQEEIDVMTKQENINERFHPRVCTKQALTALVVERAKHLSINSKFNICKLPTHEIKSLGFNPLRIAEEEIRRGLVNFVIRYTNPSGEIVEVDSNTLIF